MILAVLGVARHGEALQGEARRGKALRGNPRILKNANNSTGAVRFIN
jgi:hypothetical protein